MLDLASCDFCLFSRLKGHHFLSDDGLHTVTVMALQNIMWKLPASTCII